jgi:hypothetical protein
MRYMWINSINYLKETIVANFTWTVEKLKTKTELDGFTNVVFVAYWRCDADDGVNATVRHGSSLLPTPSDPFTPYQDLTEQAVLDAMWSNGLNKASIEQLLENSLAELAAVGEVVLPLPWN